MSVLGTAGAGCAFIAVGLVAQWAMHRQDELGRPRPMPLVRVTVLVVLAVLSGVPGAQRTVEEHRLASVASDLAQARVRVHCQDGAAAFVDAGSELGWVAFSADGVPQHSTLIKRDQCRLLNAYRSHHAAPSLEQVVAVHVLTHESMHMRGEPDEARAECQALQRDAVTAYGLGATAAEAQTLAHRYWLEVYPHMPDGYWSQECRPGGALDEHLEPAPWG